MGIFLCFNELGVFKGKYFGFFLIDFGFSGSIFYFRSRWWIWGWSDDLGFFVMCLFAVLRFFNFVILGEFFIFLFLLWGWWVSVFYRVVVGLVR